jgi:hypothetical protein
MSTDDHETASKLVDGFRREHPEHAESLKSETLVRFLEQAYHRVLAGDYVAKTEEQLDRESRASGIEKPEYEALINLATHSAADRPVRQ